MSLIEVMGLDMGQDFMTCQALFWRDADHWSAAGARRFVARLLAAEPLRPPKTEAREPLY